MNVPPMPPSGESLLSAWLLFTWLFGIEIPRAVAHRRHSKR